MAKKHVAAKVKRKFCNTFIHTLFVFFFFEFPQMKSANVHRTNESKNATKKHLTQMFNQTMQKEKRMYTHARTPAVHAYCLHQKQNKQK